VPSIMPRMLRVVKRTARAEGFKVSMNLMCDWVTNLWVKDLGYSQMDAMGALLVDVADGCGTGGASPHPDARMPGGDSDRLPGIVCIIGRSLKSGPRLEGKLATEYGRGGRTKHKDRESTRREGV
jgi:hypothetical protein